jgi:hypothetical protein
LSFYEGVRVGVLKIEESESEVLKIEESELLCTNSTALIRTLMVGMGSILETMIYLDHLVWPSAQENLTGSVEYSWPLTLNLVWKGN